jgi:hypothetical protein
LHAILLEQASRWLSQRSVLPGRTPVEAGVNINFVGEGLLAAPVGGSANGDVESGLSRSELVGEKTAVSTKALAGLLEVRSLELDAATLVEAPHAQPSTPSALDAVDLVLLLGEGSAKRRIE